MSDTTVFPQPAGNENQVWLKEVGNMVSKQACDHLVSYILHDGKTAAILTHQ
jgi:hypothetical protein